ncbi:ubiquinone biosynthesis protein UbiB [Parasulfuritortus cantonensis]|uniref:Ubiquinone biosynthesis protein UbiB n=1 Tax=Parasulfuritortus cantonensis TaxID=2528202 RepID=A0A4R1B157_9PROT|nr:AarF/UbiB family protein [Parasulfuritortus cantonensis]TCJ11724.1 ubiquinone biosynthesis protein UbiB [Parasulfuritortus cantonensis]
MLRETVSVMRDLPRLHTIASVLIHYGWGDVVRMLGLARALERAGKLLHWHTSDEIAKLDLPVRIRMAMTDLGPTFVKLGQILSTRVDVFPPGWIAEFERLHSRVPPVPFEKLRPTLEAKYGRPLEEVFDDLETEAFAAASIAQVHRARLKDGTAVILKIRRPDIVAKVEADLRIMAHLARLAEFEMPELRRYRPQQIVNQLRRSLMNELDLAKEARNLSVFARNFAEDDTVRVPRVYWDYCGEIINVQEELRGIPAGDLAAARSAGLDLQVLATRGADAVLKMILVHGHYHADPHPGNILFLAGNRVGMLDFGMVGRLTEVRRAQITDFLGALINKDEQALLNVLTIWAGDADVDEDKLAYDLTEIIFSYDDLPLREIRIAPLLSDVTAVLRENNLSIPPDLTLLFKALITLEGLGHQLDPDFHMVDHLEPFVLEVIEERYAPAVLLRRVKRGIREIGEVITGLPRDITRLLRQARRGRLRIDLDLKRLDHFGQQLNDAANRLTVGVLTASLVIGSSIIMTVPQAPYLLGLFGFLLAMANGIWLVYSIWRSGKQ